MYGQTCVLRDAPRTNVFAQQTHPSRPAQQPLHCQLQVTCTCYHRIEFRIFGNDIFGNKLRERTHNPQRIYCHGINKVLLWFSVAWPTHTINNSDRQTKIPKIHQKIHNSSHSQSTVNPIARPPHPLHSHTHLIVRFGGFLRSLRHERWLMLG